MDAYEPPVYIDGVNYDKVEKLAKEKGITFDEALAIMTKDVIA